jgi:RNA polymerase sigma factor (sigma-70 family)
MGGICQKTNQYQNYCAGHCFGQTPKVDISKKRLNFMVIYHLKVALSIMEADLTVKPKARVDSSAASRDIFFQDLYESSFPSVASFVKQQEGSFQDAKDIFQDALIIYFERSSEERLTITVSADRYILGIAKHLWLRKFRDDKRKVSLDDFERALYIPVDFYPSVMSSRLLHFLEVAGKKCLDLLRSFYFERNTLKQVASELGYSSEHSAAVQKYKCLEKIRESIKEKSVTYEDFFE